LNAERQAQLEPSKTDTAIKAIKDVGIAIEVLSNTEIDFIYKGATIKYFPYSGWASGKTIKGGRGLKNLLSQLNLETL
jgi:hypothetical protein